MQATRILAIRHGETAWNVEARIQGHLDIDLNDRGRWQAARAAQALAAEPIAAIYASDLLRAWATAQAIGAVVGVAPQAQRGLRERGFGQFEGLSYAEIALHWPADHDAWRRRAPDWAPPGGGESLLVMRERIAQTVNTLAAPHLGQQIVLVAHGGVMDLLYRLATRQALDAPRSWVLGNAAINRLIWTPEGLSLVGWADTSHLDESGLDEVSA